MTERIKPDVDASDRVCKALSRIASAQTFNNLTSRQLFHFLYVLRCLEHFQSMLLLIRHENYNSVLALRRVLFETCLRGTWLARCATNQIIENGRKNNFKIDFPRRKDLQKAVAENVKATGLELEAIFYNRGSGFVHGGVYETAMYAMRTNRKVSEHLFRTVRLQLRNSTVRVLQICLDFDVHLLQSAVAGQRHGNSQVEELTSRTTLLQTIAQQYRSDLRTLSGTRA